MHKQHIKKAIKNQNHFERSRGILTCAQKSVITPICQHPPNNIPALLIMQFNEMFEYQYRARGQSTKILGLNITSYSFTSNHVEILNTKANNMVTLMLCMKGASRKTKLHLIKALIIPTLTYPDTVLLTCSPTSFHTLQRPLNRALKWVFDIFYPRRITARRLHEAAGIKPINQIIWERGKRQWEKIMSGEAADHEYANSIVNDPSYTSHHVRFPSSYGRSMLNEPPPIFTQNDVGSNAVQLYYNDV